MKSKYIFLIINHNITRPIFFPITSNYSPWTSILQASLGSETCSEFLDPKDSYFVKYLSFERLKQGYLPGEFLSLTILFRSFSVSGVWIISFLVRSPLLNSHCQSNFPNYTEIVLLMGLPQWLRGKESTCNAGDVSLIPGSGRSPGEENSNPFQ